MKGKKVARERVQEKILYLQLRNVSEIPKHKANEIVVNKRSWIHNCLCTETSHSD